MKNTIKREMIGRKIYIIRGQRVMIDKDLALLYNVPAKKLNEQVKRNIKRFPVDFMFQLTRDEAECLRSQIGASRWVGRRHLPYAFTGQGVAMLSSVLNSKCAITVNIAILKSQSTDIKSLNNIK